MSLNIKNETTHALVRELATLTGMSQTEAVEDAVRRRLAELNAESEEDIERRVDRVLALASKMRAAFGPEGIPDHGELLYDDETGLPK